MFDKKSLLVAFLSFITVFGLQILFRGWFEDKGTQKSAHVHVAGAAYTIPSAQDLSLPALKTITFAQESAAHEAEKIAVELPLYVATFTSVGGTLESVSYLNYKDASGTPLQPISPAALPEQASFVLALGEESPLHFKHLSTATEENGLVSIAFSAKTDDWAVTKTFVLHPDTYLMDVTLAFAARRSSAAAVRPRLTIGAPHLALNAKDAPRGVVFDVEKKTLNTVTDTQRASDAWVMPAMIGVEDNYFAQVLVADRQTFVQRGYFTGPECSWVSALLEGPALTESASYDLSFYVGPKSLKPLMAVDSRLESLLGFGWLSWPAKKIVEGLSALYDLCHNYGLAIILLTILLKLLLLPFSFKSAGYMEVQQKLQPRIAALRKKYANDTTTFNAEVMRLYQEHNVSPASFMLGCLLMLPQWPLFFAMYRVLGNVVDLYQAPLGLWITDLSAKDPYYVLPALVVILTFLQPMGGMKGDSSSKALRYLMPVLLSAIFIGMPAGLLLFIMTNFVVSLLEQKARKWLTA